MKKLLLLVSLVVPLLFSNVHVNVLEAEELQLDVECDKSEDVIVRIVNNYNAFMGNGFVYKVDENYSYIVTSIKVVNEVNNFGVIYSDNNYKDAIFLGSDSYNEIAVFRTDKVDNLNGVCLANSNYLYRGQQNYLYGYINKEEKFMEVVNLSSVGNLYYSKDYINVYKSIVQVKGNDSLVGVGVFDELDRLIGMITGYDSDLAVSSYMIDSNKLIKIADSIIKTGKYKINYIKYSLVDYSNLSVGLRESYGVSGKANKGVVIVTFKPLKYIFGGLNQGMVITAVNGIEIDSCYELDRQFSRYEKNSKICLKVIKKNGKIAYYYVKI